MFDDLLEPPSKFLRDTREMADLFSVSVMRWFDFEIDLATGVLPGKVIRDRKPSLTTGSGDRTVNKWYAGDRDIALDRSVNDKKVKGKEIIIFHTKMIEFLTPSAMPSEPMRRLSWACEQYNIPKENPLTYIMGLPVGICFSTYGARARYIYTEDFSILTVMADNVSDLQIMVWPGNLQTTKLKAIGRLS